MALRIIERLNVSKEDFLRVVRPRVAPESISSVPNNEVKPLSKELTKYVENFYKSSSENNLRKLLVHGRAAFMLFHHKMANGECLFLNLFYAGRLLDLFHPILKQDKTKEAQALVAAILALSEHDYFLRFALSSIGNKHISAQTLSFEQIQKRGLGCLFAEGGSAEKENRVRYLVQSCYPLTENDLTHQYRHADGTLAPSFLHILALDGLAWASFFSSRSAGEHSLLRKALSSLAKEDNSNIVLSLIQTLAGRQWFFNNIKTLLPYVNSDVFFVLLGAGDCVALTTHWNDFKKQLKIEKLFLPVTDVGADKGITPFYLLCGTSVGHELLTRYWDDFKGHLSGEKLFAPVTAEGTDKGITPFYWLCGTRAGRALLTKHWADFKDHLSGEGLFSPAMGEGVEKGKTPFYYLCISPEGLALLTKHWDDFKEYLSSARLFAPVTAEGDVKGKTPFYFLCSSPHGREFLAGHWDDFKKHLSRAGLFAPVMGEDEGKTPFYFLCGTIEGRDLLTRHWADFKDHLSGEGLFSLATGEDGDKGATPFYWLCCTHEGQELLAKHWDDFKEHLSAERLFAPMMGDDKGATPFYWLCCTSEGLELLTRHWDDFKEHLSGGLFAPMTAEGDDTGKTPFYYLCGTSEGQELLTRHWADFKEHLSAAGLFAPMTAEGADKGKTPFYLLCSNPVGLGLLSTHWDDFKKHFQAKELFTQLTECMTGEKESLYSLLNATKEGRALLTHINLAFPNAGFSAGSSLVGVFSTRGDNKATVGKPASQQELGMTY